MWFGQTGLNVNRFETGLSASVNGALVDCTRTFLFLAVLVHFFTRLLPDMTSNKMYSKHLKKFFFPQSCAVQTSVRCCLLNTIVVLRDWLCKELNILRTNYSNEHRIFTSFFSNASENSSKFPWLVERKQDIINCGHHYM